MTSWVSLIPIGHSRHLPPGLVSLSHTNWRNQIHEDHRPRPSMLHCVEGWSLVVSGGLWWSLS